MEVVDKQELVKWIKGNLASWCKSKPKVKYRAVPQSDPTSLSLDKFRSDL